MIQEKIKYGEALFGKGQLNESERVFLDILKTEPSNSEVLNNLGVIYHQRGLFPEAERCYLESIEAKNDNLDAYLNLAHLYISVFRLQKTAELPQNCTPLHNRNFGDLLQTLLEIQTGEIRQSLLSKSNIVDIARKYQMLTDLFEMTGDTNKSKICYSFSLLWQSCEKKSENISDNRLFQNDDRNQPFKINAIKKDRSIFKKSVLFAPVIIGGKAPLLANHLRKNGFHTKVIDYFPNYLAYRSDYAFQGGNRSDLADFSNKCMDIARGFDILVFEFGCSFKYLPAFNQILDDGRTPYADIEALKDAGKKVFMSCSGSDVISQAKLHFHFLQNLAIDIPHPPFQTRRQHFLVKRLSNICDCFLSNMNFSHVLPRTVPFWETAIDLAEWPFLKRRSKKITSVLSAPTSPRKKNYGIIEGSIARIKQKYPRINHLLIKNIPHSQIRQFYEQGDLGITQATYSYGRVAVELMALGIPVIVAHHAAYPSHRELAPIINFDSVNELNHVVELVLNGEINYMDHAKRGREFVEAFHSLEVVGDALMRYVKEVSDNGSIHQIEFKNFQEGSKIWDNDPETVLEFKYFDISVPAFCALGHYEAALIDCQEAIINNYRQGKFEAWYMAIGLMTGQNIPAIENYYSTLKKNGENEKIEYLKKYKNMVFDVKGLLTEVESGQREAHHLRMKLTDKNLSSPGLERLSGHNGFISQA